MHANQTALLQQPSGGPQTSRHTPEQIIEDLKGVLFDLDRKTTNDQQAFQMALSDPRIAASGIQTKLQGILLQRAALRDSIVHRLVEMQILQSLFEDDELRPKLAGTFSLG